MSPSRLRRLGREASFDGSGGCNDQASVEVGGVGVGSLIGPGSSVCNRTIGVGKHVVAYARFLAIEWPLLVLTVVPGRHHAPESSERRAGMRVISWNIENLAPRLGELPALLDRLGNPDVLCLQEARVRASDVAMVTVMAGSAPGYVCHHSLNRDAVNASFRGGRAHGVVTYVREGLAMTSPEVPVWDLEGRFVASDCGGTTVCNVYAVNGTDKRYFDHETGRFLGDRHAFKRRFQDRVFEWARGLRRVVIAGDWNVSQTKLDTHPRLRTEEPHARARAEFAAHLAASELVDAYRELHPLDRGYTWFNPRARGGRLDAARVDFILVSRDLLPLVRSAVILDDPELRRGSDHAPVLVDLCDAR